MDSLSAKLDTMAWEIGRIRHFVDQKMADLDQLFMLSNRLCVIVCHFDRREKSSASLFAEIPTSKISLRCAHRNDMFIAIFLLYF